MIPGVIIRSEVKPQNQYGRYKQALRQDFLFRCAWCKFPEGAPSEGGYHNFEIDHFRPKSYEEFKHLENDYSNLYYNCSHCNRAKTNLWPDEEDEEAGFRFLDTCVDDIYGDHIELQPDGVAKERPGADSLAVEYTMDAVQLNRGKYVKWRKIFHDANAEKTRLEELIKNHENQSIGVSDDVIDALCKALKAAE